VRNLIEDFGYRFVFKKGKELQSVAPDFAPKNILKDWMSPVGKQHNRKGERLEAEYKEKCILSSS
jgi:hypothetical protein